MSVHAGADAKRGRLRAAGRAALGVIAALGLAGGPAIAAPRRATPLNRVALVRPEALALGPNGNLYVVDEARNEILERLPDGRFEVVAGDGREGFAGDGGPARRAELDQPGGMVFGPSGVLFVADTGNNRVRAIAPDGEIRTVAGDGRAGWAASGERATRSPLAQPAAVAIGPHGGLLIAAAQEVLELGPTGRLVRLAGIAGRFGGGDRGIGGAALRAAVGGPVGLAADRSGGLFVACRNLKWLDEITPGGRLERLSSSFYPRGSGLLVNAPGGAVYAADSQTVVRLGRFGIRGALDFARRSVPGVGVFLPDGIAVDARGDVYADTFYGNGYASRSALIEVRPNHSVRVLWRS